MSGLVLAIDGPSGSGKSSTAKAIALRANWSYLDTGALYRAATYIALANMLKMRRRFFAILKNQIFLLILIQLNQKFVLTVTTSQNKSDLSE